MNQMFNMRVWGRQRGRDELLLIRASRRFSVLTDEPGRAGARPYRTDERELIPTV
jgi:hypothetical protein